MLEVGPQSEKHFATTKPTVNVCIVDFYCASAKLVIELDGSQHYTEQGEAYDAERSACFARYGLEVIRFTNSEIDTEFDSVCRKIHTVIQERQG